MSQSLRELADYAITRYRNLSPSKKRVVLASKRKSSRLFYKRNRIKILLYWDKFYLMSPWLGSFRSAKSRCERKTHEAYERYGGRGIKFLLTVEEVKRLWLRDAVRLSDPTLDRIDNDGHYEFRNCRFIERSENGRKGDK